MTQSAKTVGRRDMLRGGAIALALTGAAAIPLATANANTQDDLLASGICDFRAEIAAIEGQDLDNFDALVERADRRLANVLRQPVVTSAGVLAVIGLVLDDYMLLSHARFGERLETRLLEAINFFASVVEGAA
jgi:hypothetical protein